MLPLLSYRSDCGRMQGPKTRKHFPPGPALVYSYDQGQSNAVSDEDLKNSYLFYCLDALEFTYSSTDSLV